MYVLGQWVTSTEIVEVRRKFKLLLLKHLLLRFTLKQKKIYLIFINMNRWYISVYWTLDYYYPNKLPIHLVSIICFKVKEIKRVKERERERKR